MRLEQLENNKVYCLHCGEPRKKGATRYCSRCKTIKHFICPYGCEGTFSVAMYARHMKRYHPKSFQCLKRKWITTENGFQSFPAGISKPSQPNDQVILTRQLLSSIPKRDIQICIKIQGKNGREYTVKPFGQLEYSKCSDRDRTEISKQMEILSQCLGLELNSQFSFQPPQQKRMLPSIRELLNPQ